MGVNGSKWELMGINGNKWESAANNGIKWELLGVIGRKSLRKSHHVSCLARLTKTARSRLLRFCFCEQ